MFALANGRFGLRPTSASSLRSVDCRRSSNSDLPDLLGQRSRTLAGRSLTVAVATAEVMQVRLATCTRPFAPSATKTLRFHSNRGGDRPVYRSDRYSQRSPVRAATKLRLRRLHRRWQPVSHGRSGQGLGRPRRRHRPRPRSPLRRLDPVTERGARHQQQHVEQSREARQTSPLSSHSCRGRPSSYRLREID
jgi:hypothetical protein